MQKDHDRIRDRAYEIWDRDGRQSGRDEEYWLQAEREMGVAAGSADHAPLGMSDQAAAAAEQIAPSRPASKKANGAAKGLAAKAPAPRKRRGSQPVSQA